MNRDLRNLRFILICIERIEAYTQAGRASLHSQLHIDAVERNLEKMADTTKQLSDSLKETAPDIPWRSIGDFRNVLAHRYHGIDYDMVWSIVADDVPVLKRFAEATLAASDAQTDASGDSP